MTGDAESRITGAATRLELFRDQQALLETYAEARERARRSYDTGDRERSATCITEHLTNEQRQELRTAHTYSCPSCGHLLKQRVREI